MAQQLAYGEELRFLVGDHAADGGDAHLAVGEGVEGVDSLVARCAGNELHDYLCGGGGVVVYVAYLYLPLLHGAQDGGYEGGGGLAEGKLGYCEGLVVDFLDFGPYLDGAAACSVVVARGVHESSGLEVGKQGEALAVKVCHGGVDHLVEVVGKDFRRQSNGDSLHALCEQEREFHGKRHRLLLASVVGGGPFRYLGAEYGFEGELGESGLDISGCGGGVACQYVAPVTLGVDEQFLLAELHEGVADGGVAVRMVLHGVADDVGHLVVASVVESLHGV